MPAIFLEAESFERLGGWVVDSQSMEQVGSAYIMAHGMGVPVQDAETCCEIPEDGRWTVWARTRDWTAAWGRGTPAGRFNIVVNGKRLPATLGTGRQDWAWQKAGTASLKKGKATIALHDLTGFNGRCDAIYMTTDAKDVPPNGKEELAEFRRKALGLEVKEIEEEFDFVVAGGGIAGICAAISAARSGVKVALIHDRAILGGCNSSEVRVGVGGFAHSEPYPNLGRVVSEIEPLSGGAGTYKAETYEDARKEIAVRREGNCALFLNERVVGLEVSGGKIGSLTSRNARTGAETRFKAKLFADCTGDASLSKMAGAGLMYGREASSEFNEELAPERADRQVMGLSVLWYARKGGAPAGFPEIDWGLEIDESNAYYIRGGDWEWETGQYRDQANETEYIRDYGMMAIYANWSFLKNRSKRKDEWAEETLGWVSPVGGKRESYRVVGDLILTENDIENHVAHPDATGAITWSIDLHFPDPENTAKFKEPFRSCAYHRGIGKPYAVPYRCLYAKDVRNLFLGGRIISMTHVAFSCVRVQRTLGALGEVIGLAAGVCAKEGLLPRDVYEKRFAKLKELMEAGVPVPPPYHADKPGDYESYHFKEIGFLLHREPGFDDSLMRRISALGVKHKNWDK